MFENTGLWDSLMKSIGKEVTAISFLSPNSRQADGYASGVIARPSAKLGAPLQASAKASLLEGCATRLLESHTIKRVPSSASWRVAWHPRFNRRHGDQDLYSSIYRRTGNFFFFISISALGSLTFFWIAIGWSPCTVRVFNAGSLFFRLLTLISSTPHNLLLIPLFHALLQPL